ncbi:MAG: hypothetical protein R3F37_13610 [Candidatus Competibacteraceae bacterium]
MKHDAYQFENLNLALNDGRVDIDRYINEARQQHDAYIADCIVRGVRWLTGRFDNGIAKPVQNSRSHMTLKAPS